MNLDKIIKYSFFVGLTSGLIGAYLKIVHFEYSKVVLSIYVLSNVVFTISSIYEVRKSDRFNFNEKTMWTIALIFLSGFAGILYFTIGRKRLNYNENRN